MSTIIVLPVFELGMFDTVGVVYDTVEEVYDTEDTGEGAEQESRSVLWYTEVKALVVAAINSQLVTGVTVGITPVLSAVVLMAT